MKHHFALRWLSCSLLLFSIAATPTAAITPSYTVTGSYLSSTYYQNLTALPKTGDLAFDTLAIALSQLDYHEGNSTADFGGKNASGSGNYTEYNYALGQIGGTYGYAWCAAFVSFCLEQAGATESAGGLFASCTLWVERLRALGQYSTRASGYTPKTGDLIFFRSAGVARDSDHVGLVRYVKGGRVYTVEGNSSDRVSLRDYALSDSYIVGYGRPNYQSSKKLPLTALESEDKVAGLYVVTNSFLNVRDKASSSGKKLGSLSKGEMISVTSVEGGWGFLLYKGQKAFVSLDYADFAAPHLYTVTYDSGTGQGSPFKYTYYSMESAVVNAETPTREKFVFIGWKTDSDTLYQKGDKLPAGDLKLSAVWEAQIEGSTTPQEPAVGEGVTESDRFDAPGSSTPETAPLLPDDSRPGTNTAAERAAGVITALGTAGALGFLAYRRRREE